MQRPISHILHDQKYLLRCLDHIKKLSYINMLHTLHQLNFSFYRLSSLRLKQFYLLINLDSYFLLCFLIHSYSDYGISTSSYDLSNRIVINRGLFTKLFILGIILSFPAAHNSVSWRQFDLVQLNYLRLFLIWEHFHELLIFKLPTLIEMLSGLIRSCSYCDNWFIRFFWDISRSILWASARRVSLRFLLRYIISFAPH